MIIDSHYHLEEKMETVDRLVDRMARCGINRVCLIPTMVDPFRIGHLAEKMSGAMKKALQSKLHPLGLLMYKSTVTGSGKFALLGKKFNIYPNPDNALVANAMAKHPDKFFGWIFVNPKSRNPFDEIGKYAGKPGWIGVKAHPFWNAFPVSVLDDVAKYCGEKNMPLLIHLGGTKERGDYKYLPDRHPKTKIIYAHAGVPFYGRMWDYVASKPNVWIDLSSPYCNEPMRIAAVEKLGARKCLYGSDGPYGYEGPDGLYDHAAILEEIKRLPVSDADREIILGGNFKEIAAI